MHGVQCIVRAVGSGHEQNIQFEMRGLSDRINNTIYQHAHGHSLTHAHTPHGNTMFKPQWLPRLMSDPAARCYSCASCSV